MGSLKKNYFKPIQKVYESSLPAQINEIKTENRKVIQSSPNHSSTKNYCSQASCSKFLSAYFSPSHSSFPAVFRFNNATEQPFKLSSPAFPLSSTYPCTSDTPEPSFWQSWKELDLYLSPVPQALQHFHR